MLELSDKLEIQAPSPIQTIDYQSESFFTANFYENSKTKAHNRSLNIKIWCKRDDQLHPIISGNKWRKLKPVLTNLIRQKHKALISFGGAYSNHLHALAYCCFKLNIRLVAVIRGELSKTPSPTILDMQKWGTQLHFVSRLEYKQRDCPKYLHALKARFMADLVIPEGGSSSDALDGFKDFVKEIEDQNLNFTQTFLPVASGASMAGLIRHGQRCLGKINGVAVLKGQGYLDDLVLSLLTNNKAQTETEDAPWHIHHQFHQGGYAKSTEILSAFADDFYQQTQIELESVYSAKCFFAAFSLLSQQDSSAREKVLLVHTGGLQGARKTNTSN